MTARVFRAAVIGLALAASGLTARAMAAESDPTPPGASATPLNVRATKSLELAPPPEGSGIGWKLGTLVLISALGIWTWRRRSPTTLGVDLPALRILRRTSIGVRSELLVVEMDGQRLLLGVTPSTIQNLYIAPLLDDEIAAAAEPEKPIRLLTPRPEIVRQTPRERTTARRPTRPKSDEPIEEQARGIHAVTERK